MRQFRAISGKNCGLDIHTGKEPVVVVAWTKLEMLSTSTSFCCLYSHGWRDRVGSSLNWVMIGHVQEQLQHATLHGSQSAGFAQGLEMPTSLRSVACPCLGHLHPLKETDVQWCSTSQFNVLIFRRYLHRSSRHLYAFIIGLSFCDLYCSDAVPEDATGSDVLFFDDCSFDFQGAAISACEKGLAFYHWGCSIPSNDVHNILEASISGF